MAWLYANQPIDAALLLSTADRAAIRAAGVLKLLDQVQSLEFLAKKAGANKAQTGGLREHFREQWMVDARTRIRLGVI
jgi:hypothetical protein